MSATRTTLTTGSLLVLAVFFVALIILSNHFLRGARLDLTENNLFTLSEGSRNILSSIDEPINLYFFYSERASRDIPVLRTYATRVQELLEEFVQVSNGQLNLHIIDPLPFSEEEDRAAQFGLQAIPVGAANENVYFGLAGTNSTDGLSVVPFFQPDKEAFLEYDLTKLVYNLANPTKPVVALISGLPMSGGFDPMTRQPSQPWVIYEQMQPLFDLRVLGGDIDKIDDDVGVLMIVHPKDLSDKTQYAIDQYILGGGHAVIFVDPQAELETPANPNDPSGMFAEKSSTLEKLFTAWGVDYNKDQILGDSGYALSVSVAEGQAPVRHLGILSIESSGLDNSDVITADLSTVNIAMSGFFKLAEDSKLNLNPLIQSSRFAAPIEASKARFVPDPNELAKGFQETGERYTVAARLSGEAASAFPDGAPKAEGEEPSDTEESSDSDVNTDHLSRGSINAVLVADTDILTDRLWVRSQNFFGQRLVSAWANNGDFVVNAVDNLLGNSDLISMRSRATSSRPFTTVQELERQADAQFRVKEQELQAELQETEAKLNELQQNRPDTAQQGQGILQSLILSPEQQAEVEKFQQRKLEIRKDLRQVRHELDQGIETLGNWLKFINIGLIPILLSVLALIMALVVRSRRNKPAH